MRSLKAIPFLAEENTYVRNEVEQKIQKIIEKRLTELEGWPGNYNELAQNKAIAIQYRGMESNPFVSYEYRQDSIYPSIGYWGGAWEVDTLEEAKQRAIKNCKGNCMIYMENEKLADLSSLVDDYIAARNLHVQLQLKALRHARVRILANREITYGVGLHIKDKFFQTDWSEASINIGYPDMQRDYSSSCQRLVFYALLPVDSKNKRQYLRRLNRMNNLGFYGFYIRSAFEEKSLKSAGKGHLKDNMAKFTRRYSGDFSPLSSGRMKFPKNLIEVLNKEIIKVIWIEGSVRVSTDGIPMVQDVLVSPLAIETDRHFYLGVEIHMPDDKSFCFSF